MSNNLMSTREIYLRHTDCAGRSDIRWHIVHNADAFLAARQAEASKLNAEQKPGEPRMARVELATKEQYDEERKRT